MGGEFEWCHYRKVPNSHNVWNSYAFVFDLARRARRAPITKVLMQHAAVFALLAQQAKAQPTNPECTGVMALSSPSGAAAGPWHGPTVIYE